MFDVNDHCLSVSVSCQVVMRVDFIVFYVLYALVLHNQLPSGDK